MLWALYRFHTYDVLGRVKIHLQLIYFLHLFPRWTRIWFNLLLDLLFNLLPLFCDLSHLFLSNFVKKLDYSIPDSMFFVLILGLLKIDL
jgi:hypothetical protein